MMMRKWKERRRLRWAEKQPEYIGKLVLQANPHGPILHIDTFTLIQGKILIRAEGSILMPVVIHPEDKWDIYGQDGSFIATQPRAMGYNNGHYPWHMAPADSLQVDLVLDITEIKPWTETELLDLERKTRLQALRRNKLG